MKKILFCLCLLICSGCAVHHSSIHPLNTFQTLSQNVVDTMIYQQADEALKNLQHNPYSVKVELTSGPVMTLLVSNQEVTQLMVHGQGYTQWIQIFDDRILCLTGDDGHVEAELLDDLSAYGDMETIIRCALDPVSLVAGRHFQRTSGAEEGSAQIATDNIDFWMKVSSKNLISQVKLYFSDLPMMTLYYSEEVPLFPTFNKTDYPLYSDIMDINEDVLIKNGFEMLNDQYIRSTEKMIETITFNDDSFDYTIENEKYMIYLNYDELVLKGKYVLVDQSIGCEVILNQSDETAEGCTDDAVKTMKDSFEKLRKEFETHNFTQ